MFLIHAQALSYVPKTPKPVTISTYILGIIGLSTSCTIYAALSSWLAHSHSKFFEKKIRIGMRKITILTIVDIVAFSCASIALVFLNIYIVIAIGTFKNEDETNYNIDRASFFSQT